VRSLLSPLLLPLLLLREMRVERMRKGRGTMKPKMGTLRRKRRKRGTMQADFLQTPRKMCCILGSAEDIILTCARKQK